MIRENLWHILLTTLYGQHLEELSRQGISNVLFLLYQPRENLTVTTAKKVKINPEEKKQCFLSPVFSFNGLSWSL
jgi:hypothetical protein